MDSAHRRNKQEDEGQSGPTAKIQSSRDFSQQPHESVQRTNKTAHGILHDSLGEHTDIAPPKITSYPKPSSQNYSTQTPLDKDRRSTRRNQDPLVADFLRNLNMQYITRSQEKVNPEVKHQLVVAESLKKNGNWKTPMTKILEQMN